MNAAIKSWINRGRIGKNGIASVYIRVTIDRFKKEIKLDVRWPARFFDDKSGLCKPRFADDQECNDNNIIIRREIAKCNEVFRYYRLADLPLSINRFYKDYSNNLSKSSFTEYMLAKITSRHRDKEITGATKARHMATYNKICKFSADVRFADFNSNWAADFDKWLKRNIKSQKQVHSQNSRWAHHKVMKTYLALARKDLIRFDHPYDQFSIRMVAGNWKAIFESDVIALYKYYKSENCKGQRRAILRAFLFSCMTGLRVSDLHRIKSDNLMDGILVFVPYKTRKQNSMHKIPLNKMAMELFKDALNESNADAVFSGFSEQFANRELKTIANKIGIEKNLHWHVGRHTFISLYYAKSRDLVATKEFAGHKNIQQTMIYTHQNPDEIKDKMRVMDDIG